MREAAFIAGWDDQLPCRGGLARMLYGGFIVVVPMSFLVEKQIYKHVVIGFVQIFWE